MILDLLLNLHLDLLLNLPIERINERIWWIFFLNFVLFRCFHLFHSGNTKSHIQVIISSYILLLRFVYFSLSTEFNGSS